ncbi:hypothetical protein J31TS4_16610 [Paenibacillus sp. J31TS4]|uniref:hypothetical protein n=1 Tax=Paenibacillus sp. J31TS4 TaxID=2807195 RepID=UPI001B11B5E2|nr:hypothetical protein [Paenibacillus sp. J31TS4]GIP38381.1 hypothetical protein J31TS4_16610 [Paenibacillus sp. J31TS4]
MVIVCSAAADLLTVKLLRYRRVWRAVLHTVAGYAFFNVLERDEYTVLAGIIGALCALLFYAGTLLVQGPRRVFLLFGLVLPLSLFLLGKGNFTQKRGWSETREATSLSASFQQFHGRHEIPVAAREGELLEFAVTFAISSGGYGYHVMDEQGRLVGMNESGGRHIVKIGKPGIYRITITGDRAEGGFRVEWSLEEAPNG